MPRIAHKPTEETRRQVEALAGYGIIREVICNVIGVSLPTLIKYYRRELDGGDAQAQAQIARAAFDKAVKDKDTAMIIWLTKTRLGWKDHSRVIIAGDADNPLEVNHSARDRIAGRIARLAAAEEAQRDPPEPDD